MRTLTMLNNQSFISMFWLVQSRISQNQKGKEKGTRKPAFYCLKSQHKLLLAVQTSAGKVILSAVDAGSLFLSLVFLSLIPLSEQPDE